MAKPKMTDVVTKLVDTLEPLTAEERQRAIQASLTLLGDEATTFKRAGEPEDHNGSEKITGLHKKAQLWMKQNGISTEQIQQVFHIENGVSEVIAPEMPGKNNVQKTHNAYVLTGIAQLLSSGNPFFDDKSARSLCQSSGCYDRPNHATSLSKKGNEFTGSKDKGWTLTAPGLKRGAALVKELNGQPE